MEVSIPIMESGTHVRVQEEKMMMCSNNCVDIAFDDANCKMHDEKMFCASNCEDGAFHMEVLPSNMNDGEVLNSGRDSVVDLKENDEEVLSSGRDGVVCLKENDEGDLNLGCDGVLCSKRNDGVVSNLGCLKENEAGDLNSVRDGIVCLKGNDGVVSNLGCLNGNGGVVSSLGHDGVVDSKGNNGEVLDSGRDGVVGLKGYEYDGVVSNIGHDGVVGMKVNHGVASNLPHDGVVELKGLNDGVVEVDIVNNVDVDEERVAEMDTQDGTECSSSFGCTNDTGDGSTEVSSDSEVESHFQDDNTSFLRSKGLTDLVKTRKKKLTSHWRKFIRPLMWRCKWVELHLRELHSQTCKYDRELSECEKRKRSQLAKCATEELGLKSTPFNDRHRSVNLMKRKKRKRVEETIDLASYTSCHNLFSYNASRRSITDSLYMDDVPGNTDVSPMENSPFVNNELGINADLASFEFNSCDTFESILRKVEDAQLHARQLRVKMDKIVRENGGKITSSSSIPGDKYARNTALNSVSPCVNPEKFAPGSVFTPSEPMSEKKKMMPVTVAHGYGGTVLPSNVAKSTEPTQTGGKLVKTGLQSQTHSQPSQAQLHESEEVGDRPPAESQLVTEIPDPNGKTTVNGGQAAKLCKASKVITPRNKRNRGRRRGYH